MAALKMAAHKSSSKTGASKSKSSRLSALKKLVLGATRGAAATKAANPEQFARSAREAREAKAAKESAAKATGAKGAASKVSSKDAPKESAKDSKNAAAKMAKDSKTAAPAAKAVSPVIANAAGPVKSKRPPGINSKAHRSSSGFQAAQALAAVKNMGAAPPVLDASGAESVCREVACENLATTGGYCRLHYIKNWKKIKRKELILREKKLNQYIEELVLKYPDKYIEAIRQDLANDKEFAKVISDLDLDESVDEFEGEGGEAAENLIDNIKRDFDDEGDAF